MQRRDAGKLRRDKRTNVFHLLKKTRKSKFIPNSAEGGKPAGPLGRVNKKAALADGLWSTHALFRS